MADETPETPSAVTPAANAGQPSGPVITPEIEAVIQERERKARDSGAAEARRAIESKKPKAPARPSEETPTSDADARLSLFMAFDDATAGMNLKPGQRKLLRDSVLAQRPGDVADFVRGFSEQAGWTSETPVPPKQPAATPTPSGRPASDAGAPAGGPSERPSDPLTWTKEDIDRFYASKGKAPDMYDARNAEVHKEIRTMARNRLARMRVLLGPRR